MIGGTAVMALYEMKPQRRPLLLSEWISNGYQSTSPTPTPTPCPLCGDPNGTCTNTGRGERDHDEQPPTPGVTEAGQRA